MIICAILLNRVRRTIFSKKVEQVFYRFFIGYSSVFHRVKFKLYENGSFYRRKI